MQLVAFYDYHIGILILQSIKIYRGLLKIPYEKRCEKRTNIYFGKDTCN